MSKTKIEFKIGDLVKVTGNTNSSRNEVGDVGTIKAKYGDSSHRPMWAVHVPGGATQSVWTLETDMELVLQHTYEDKWNLNDGTVPVPEGADTLEKDGSVIAFRRRLAPPFSPKFGDRVRVKAGQYPLRQGQRAVYLKRDFEGYAYVVFEGETTTSLIKHLECLEHEPF